MNFITTGTIFDRATPIRAGFAPDRHSDLPHPPYAFLSARELRGLVAAMVD